MWQQPRRSFKNAKLNFGTLNVRGCKGEYQRKILAKDALAFNIDILGLSEMISDRICSAQIKLRKRMLIVISAYAPTVQVSEQNPELREGRHGLHLKDCTIIPKIERNPNRNQIDYIITKCKHRMLIKNSRSHGGLETKTDHKLVKMEMKIT